jgi:hypothetical protein
MPVGIKVEFEDEPVQAGFAVSEDIIRISHPGSA